MVRGGPKAFVQERHSLRGLLQELAHSLRVYDALCEALVDGLHQSGDLVIGLARRFEEHGGSIVEGDGFIHGAEEVAVLLHQLRDDVCRVSIRGPGPVCRLQDFLLDLILVA